MRPRLGVLVLSLVGCASFERGTVQGQLSRAPEVAEISFVPELELRPFLAHRQALRERLEFLSAARLDAELTLRRVTNESLLCRLALVRSPPPRRELELQKRKLSASTAAALNHRRALIEWTDAARREASLPPPPAALTVTPSRDGRFEAALTPGRYGVAVRSLGHDGRWHTSLAWTQVEADAVGEVQLEDTELELEQ